MEKDAKIFIAGHKGLVGSAILRNLRKKGYSNFVTKSHQELDLTDCSKVSAFFQIEKPEYVFLAAAKVGGIVANNTYRADFMYENLMIQTNVIHHSYLNKVKKLMFFGSTCIYPKNSSQPIKEEYLLTGDLEYTNEPYAIAKIAGFKMCDSYNLQYGTNFISVMPTSLYGPRDNYNLETSHVLPALIRKMHLGKALEENNWNAIKEDINKRPIKGLDGSEEEEVILQVLENYGVKRTSEDGRINSVAIEIWGSGKPMREFLWSDDLADACSFLMENVDFNDIVDQIPEDSINSEVRNTHINIGTGKEISIRDLAFQVKSIVGFGGEITFNTEKPDGTMRKLTHTSKLEKLGWKYKTELEDGIKNMYSEYLLKINSTPIKQREKVLE